MPAGSRTALRPGSRPAPRLASLALAAALLAPCAPALAGDAFDAPVTTLEMLSRLNQPWVQLIDVRSADEFAGRDIRALRGGHIPGAVSIPFNRLTADPEAAAAVLARFDRRKETIVYGHDSGQADRVATLLRELGFRHVRVYPQAWQVWGNSLELPVAEERFADVAALRERLEALQRVVAQLSARAAFDPAPEPVAVGR